MLNFGSFRTITSIHNQLEVMQNRNFGGQFTLFRGFLQNIIVQWWKYFGGNNFAKWKQNMAACKTSHFLAKNRCQSLSSDIL